MRTNYGAWLSPGEKLLCANKFDASLPPVTQRMSKIVFSVSHRKLNECQQLFCVFATGNSTCVNNSVECLPPETQRVTTIVLCVCHLKLKRVSTIVFCVWHRKQLSVSISLMCVFTCNYYACQ